jgi:hypothetical protein
MDRGVQLRSRTYTWSPGDGGVANQVGAARVERNVGKLASSGWPPVVATLTCVVV